MSVIFQISVICIVLLFSCVFCAPQGLVRLKSNPDYMKVMIEYRKAQSKISKEQLRTITTLGIVSGAIEFEKAMKNHIRNMISDLLFNMEIENSTIALDNIIRIEKALERDRRAVEIMGYTLDLAAENITIDEYRENSKRILRDFNKSMKEININSGGEDEFSERLESVKDDLIKHMDNMHNIITSKTKSTMNFLQMKHLKNNQIITSPFKENNNIQTLETNELIVAEEKINENIIGFKRKQDNTDENIEIIDQETTTEENSIDQIVTSELIPLEENKNENEEVPQPGGLVGLLAGLTGGENGIDVGALVGSLTGLIMSLFGPGGLDIPTLLSTGTSIIAGLLAGDRNFGTVLGEYVGTAVDGLSGGGGAINNGKFFGNFLGTVFAQLSADPEDDDEPPKPKVFIENFFQSFFQSKNQDGMDGGEDDQQEQTTMGSESDPFGCIKKIIHSVLGGVTSLILNASLGLIGGASQGIGALSAGSANLSHPHLHLLSKG